MHDRLAVGDRLVNLADFLEDTLLKGFGVVLSYDLGNGLTIERGGDLVDKWQGAELSSRMREPLPAIQWIGRYLRYLGNLRALGSKEQDAERRGDRARRRITSCRPTARASNTAASPACCAPGPASRRSPSCRSPAC